ncbi:hypothetical protein [Burkholderia vietnamiensis]|uniref:hypothetical protein n=1 Tax=Burkholderia vietnamiensis TaxID=60552 RepID=UPI0012DB0ACF|nr:hypothetical protein [Burkholderia vietnamiensis]
MSEEIDVLVQHAFQAHVLYMFRLRRTGAHPPTPVADVATRHRTLREKQNRRTTRLLAARRPGGPV